jgi:hypothetical protein
MKKVLVATVLTVLMSGASAYALDAVGSSFGTLTTARAIGQGKGNFGFGVGIADRTSFVGAFAFGLSQYSDGRIKLGLSDPDYGDAKLTLAADYKWQFWNYGAGNNGPFDGAVGMFLEYADYDFVSALQFGGQFIGSVPIRLRKGGTLSPYGRFNARVEWLSYDYPVDFRGDDSESNLEVGLNGGVQWQMTSTVATYIEFQVDGNDGIFFGLELNTM